MRSVLRRVLLMLATLAAMLLASEFALRGVWTPRHLASSPDRGPHPFYGTAPLAAVVGRKVTAEYDHRFRHTAQGWRGRCEVGPREEHATASGAASGAAAVQRVLLLGDSFTWGLGVDDEQTFASRLEADWPGVEVANTGTIGYGTREALAVLDLFGSAFRPDVAVLVFFWNDLDDNLARDWPHYGRDAEGRVVRLDGRHCDLDPLAAQPTRLPERGLAGRLRLVQLAEHAWLCLRYQLWGIPPRAVDTPEGRERAWRVTEELIGLLADRAREIDCRLVVVSLPDYWQVDPRAQVKGLEAVHVDVQAPLAEICQRRELPLVDLLPALRAAADDTCDASDASDAGDAGDASEPLYYRADRHLTARGHAVVAGELERVLWAELAARATDVQPSPDAEPAARRHGARVTSSPANR